MKIKYLKFKNWILAALAGMLGMQQGCDKILPAEEYGCPHADYHIKGTVINEDGIPIQGIGVDKWRDWDSQDGEWNYRDTTDANGHFSIGRSGFGSMMEVSLSDIDGAENGSYQDTVVYVSFEDVPFRGGDGSWYQGLAEKEVTVTMRRSE